MEIKNKFKKFYLNDGYKEIYDIYLKNGGVPLYPEQRLKDLVLECIKLGASDIHFEPLYYSDEDLEKELLVNIRVRIGGKMFYYLDISKEKKYGIIKMGDEFSQYLRGIKLITGLGQKSNELPLDGNYDIKVPDTGTDVNLRINFIPTGIELQNEVGSFMKMTMRILDNKKSIYKFDEVGLLEKDQGVIRNVLHKDQGFIIMAGPTGSGKSTTLYSMIEDINSPDINIMTVEDPIEYKIDGINQSKVNNKSEVPYTFALALRAMLRQDPDVILIGEIRDKETGKISIEAALTGHLVLSTIHANNSIQIFSRFIQMDIEKFQVINGIDIGFSQRLLPTVCPHCSKKTTIKDHNLKQYFEEEFDRNFLGYDFSSFTSNDFNRLYQGKVDKNKLNAIEKSFKDYKTAIDRLEYLLIDDKDNQSYKNKLIEIRNAFKNLNTGVYQILKELFFNIVVSDIVKIQDKTDINICSHCHGEGFLGRKPIFEVINKDEELSELLLSNASSKELNRYVEKKGIFTLKKYAFLLFMEGKINFQTYLNVT